jgi:predicted MFS family arabinose efflux permease
VYVGFVGLFALMFAAIMAMLTLLPFLLENHYGLSVSFTGVLTGVIPVCGFSGSLISMALSKYVTPFQIVRLGMFPYFLVFVLLLAMTFLHQELPVSVMTWWPFLVPCILMLMIQTMFIPVVMSFALEELEDKAGVAQGAAMCIQALAMALGSKVAIALWDGTPRSFYGTLAMIIGVAQLWLWLILGLCPPARLRGADSMPPGKDVPEIGSVMAVSDEGSTSMDEESVPKAASASPEMNHALPIGASVV